MKILITGGAGFIGSHTANWIARTKHRVMVLDNLRTGKTSNLEGRAQFCLADIVDIKSLESAFSEFQPDAVIHLAAQSAITTSKKNPYIDARVNILGTLNVLQMSLQYGVKKFVFSSTSAIYDSQTPLWNKKLNENSRAKPESPYGISKLAAEHYVRTMFPNHVIFRYGNVYGPKQTPIGENQVIARALSHFTHGNDFHVVGHGNQVRDFVYVEDVAFANFVAATQDQAGTFNLATGKSRSVNDILRNLEEIYAVVGYRWVHSKENDPRGDVFLDNRKVVKEFGFSFTPLHEGLKKTVEWWQDK